MTIDAKQLYFILDNTPSEQNIMLVGKHGIGKSRILEEYFSARGQKVVTLFLGQMSDPGDLIGLPEKNSKTGRTDFMLPYWFPVDDKPVVLFLDELNRARPEVLQTVMDLTLNRKLAGKSLPKGSRIISAVNNGNEYQLTDLDPALVSRFNIYEFSPTVEDWLEWAKNSEIDNRIISFISENPDFLDEADIQNESDNFERHPDRRSWERTSEIIKKVHNLTNSHRILIGGIIGNRISSLFFEYISQLQFPTAKQILEGDFENVLQKLETLESINLVELNESIVKYLDYLGKIIGETKVAEENSLSDELNQIFSNLNKYFDFLENENSKELVTHFISLFDSKKYQDAQCLIFERQTDFFYRMFNQLKEF